MNASQSNRPYEVLMVEDNWGDALLMSEAFKESRILAHLNIVSDGEEALEFLRHKGKYDHTPVPDIILLDLNLPRMDGRALLRQLKSDPDFKSIPVIVLTSSNLESDIREVYENNANCYLLKPADLNGFTDIVNKLKNFWFSMAKLPTRLD